MLGGDAARGGGFGPYGLGQTPGSAGFPLGTLGGAQGGLPPGVRGGLPTASAPQQGRYAAQALQSNLAQLGQFQARQGALAAAGIPPPAQGGELTARRGALMAAGLLPPNFSGPLPAGSLRDSNDPHIRAHLDSLASSRGTPPGPLARGAAAANLQAPTAPAPPVVSQGMHPQAFHQHLAAQAALNSYPAAAAGTSRLNGSSMQQLQNTGRMGAGLGGSAAVNLLHQGAAMPGISAAPPTSLAPSQDLLSLLSRQKQGGGLPVSAAPPAASAAMSMPTSDPFAALRKGAVPPPGVDGFSILNEEFPALPGSTARTDADPGPPPFSAPAAAAAAGMSAGLAPPAQPPQPLQPTTARGGFALMPSVSGADAAYGGGSAGGDAALRAQKAAAAASLSGMDYERLLRFQHAQQQHAAATAATSQGGAAAAAAPPLPPPHHALPVFSGASDPRGVRGAGGTAAAAAVATATGLVLGGSPDGGRLGFTHLEGGGGEGGANGGGALGPLQAEEGRRGLGLPDRFGLLGLMPLLKMSDADLTMLSLGTDLTSLGLNLNSSDNLHKALVSPLADVPVKTPEPEFELPACYKHTPQRLQPGYLTKFKEETLFYIFYSMPGDEAQLIAADELSCRGWLYHKRLRMWLLHVPGAIPQKSARGERGSFVVFNHTIWEAEQKPDMEILYDDLEKPPRLVRSKTVQQQQQPHPPSLMMQHAAAAAGMPASSGAFPPGMQPTPVMQ